MDEDDQKRLSEIEEQNREDRKALKKQCEEALSRVLDLLLLFSGDGRLTYHVDDAAEQFALDPDQRRVSVPLSFFTGMPFDETCFLFHLYTVLALYPDYERNPEGYLRRDQTFRREAEVLTGKFLQKAKDSGVSTDKAYQPDIVFSYVSGHRNVHCVFSGLIIQSHIYRHDSKPGWHRHPAVLLSSCELR